MPDPKGSQKALGSTTRVSFLDCLMEESQTYARELGERLKERAFEEIFPHFAEGFIQSMGGPETLLALPDDERRVQLDRVYQGTLTFLYRLLFLLYAESRDLLPVREVRGYYRISLRRLCEEIAEQAGPLEDLVPRRLEDAYLLSHSAGAEGECRVYDRLLDLFKVIDRGRPARNVPTYNGGLFITSPREDDTGREAEAARFLEETALPDRYLSLGLDRLARDVYPKRGDLGFIDYKSLGVRQLGSIYEGLLEFNIEIAKDEEETGAVRLISDKGERKATGSYYTPDYIVKYIVRHTVGPVLDEKLDALRPRLHEAEDRFRKVVKRKVELEGVTPDEPMLLQNVAGDVLHDLFDVKICDPAMGSGHFLVEAVDYVTDRLVRFLDGFPFLGVFFEGMRRSILEEMERQKVTVDPSQLTDVTLLKRHVLKRCIYGVDLNPMAVELAKVSLWLDCFTLGAPLSFLDHHLRCGNSLIGAMAREVEEDMGSPTAEGQMTFLTGPFVGLLQAADVMQVLSRLADVTLEQVRESRSLFDDFEQQAKPFKQLLDIHVARHFGVERAEEFLTVYGAEAMEAEPEELDKPYREVVERTRELYEEKRFCHWDLEFPEVFIDLERAAWKEDGGFDAVVGNPPYISTPSIADEDKRYFRLRYETSGKEMNTFGLFIESALDILGDERRLSFIVPDSFLNVRSYAGLRSFLLGSCRIARLMEVKGEVFEEAVVGNSVVFVLTKQEQQSRSESGRVQIDRVQKKQVVEAVDAISQDRYQELPDVAFVTDSEVLALFKRLSRGLPTLGQVADLRDGIKTGNNSRFVTESAKDDKHKPLLTNSDITRYHYEYNGLFVLYDRSLLEGPREEWIFLADEKIVLRQTSDRIIAALDRQKFYTLDNTHLILPVSEDYQAVYLLTLVNSRLIDYIYQFIAGESGRVFAQVRVVNLEKLPIRPVFFTTPQGEPELLVGSLVTHYHDREREALLSKTDGLLPKNNDGNFLAFQPGATGAEEKSDVVHDLLAYLAEQMIAMHEEKQERVEAFWEDLEAACESPGTFEELREHGKWEQSLWKDPACRPYVDRESRSTRHLDESLAWNEGCYEAFAGMLAGKTSVTRPMMDVYQEHHPAYKHLVERIEATDDLIDQIVYRLYGLTEEEIAVVGGRTTTAD